MSRFYIAVSPVASKFAKALQQSLREKVKEKVLRVDHAIGINRINQGKKVFQVTPHPRNKIEQFRAFTASNVSCPVYSTDHQGLDRINSRTILARTLINSTGGRGIITFARGESPPQSPLFVEYIPKKAEYRVHVFNGQVIDVQQKLKSRRFNSQDRDTHIRNLANGYIYSRSGISPPAGIDALAINAVNAVGYIYGAVDIIYNEKRDALYVLEVNSRPGLMGTTLEKYVSALINTFNLTRK